jgi:hypothetical protein
LAIRFAMFIPVRFAIDIVIDRWFRVAAEDPHFGHVRRHGWRRGRRGRFRFANPPWLCADGWAALPTCRSAGDGVPTLSARMSFCACSVETDGHGLYHGRVFLAVVGDLAHREP